MDLNGRRVLVTGGASGMGFLIARRAAMAGADVAIWDVNPAALDKATAEIAAAVEAEAPGGGRRVVGAMVDVGDAASVARAAASLRVGFGDPDVLVNNAGIVSGRRLLDLGVEDVERTLRVNAAALFWTAQAFLPAMIGKRYGHLVTMASAGGLVGVPGLSDYCASKFGAVGFHESLRAELRTLAPGIGTTLVCPFFVGTGMFDGVRTRFPRLLPILDPERVAEATVRGIERNRAVVVLPWFVHSLRLLRLLPSKWLDPLAAFFGIHDAMNTFEGRRGSAR